MNAPSIDLLDGDWYARDPLAHYTWMRAHQPVYHDEANDVWALTLYEDVAFASKSPRLFCSGRGMRPHMQEPIVPSMINMDDPRHRQRRALVNTGFTPRRVSELEAKVREVCGELIDGVSEKGECDFVRDIAAPLPMVMIGDMLGIRPEDRDKLLRWSEDLLLGTTSTPTPEMMERTRTASLEYAQYTLGVVRERRSHPTDDLMSALVHAEVGGERLDDEALIHESMLILVGGDETTRHVISGGMEALIRHPEQRRKLLDDPRRIPRAVEELLRWVSPIHNMARTTVRDVELRGQLIPEGSSVLLVYPSANRDQSVFDGPDELNVERDPNHHVAFGGNGPHFCLGAALARLELRVMFEELLRRLPDLRLAGEDLLPRRASNFIVGFESMPVEFTPSG